MKNKTNTYTETDKLYHFPIYGRYPITLEKGKGSTVWDIDGNKYIDAMAGIAVNSLGYKHPEITKAIKKQVDKLIHISNYFTSVPLTELEKKLNDLTGMDKMFFVNSGAEATEGAIKIARRYNFSIGRENPEIITMENAFHGRTLGTIAMGKEKYQTGFGPIPQGFVNAKLNDIDDFVSKINDKTGAIIIETIQGEGGVIPAEKEYLQAVRKICDEKNILMIMDEVQSGVGRSGYFFAYEYADIKPDIVCTAKGIASGFPMGAVFATDKVANSLSPGSHGTTFGGGPLACATSLATIKVMTENNFLDDVKEKGQYLFDQLRKKIGKNSNVKDIRGWGLMIGVELTQPSKPVIMDMLDNGVISNATAETVIRIVPPLVITKSEINKIVKTLKSSLVKIYGN